MKEMKNVNDAGTEKSKMDGKTKHPFAIMCRFCGSSSVKVTAFDYYCLEIACKKCGKSIECGVYHTDQNDYRDC